MKEYPVNLLRFNEYIRLLMAKPAEKGGILLYGSSFFTRWEHAAEEMLKASEGRYHVVNRGFGGATADEILSNVLRGTGNSRGIVLMHDSSAKYSTVAALRSVIWTLRDMGYSFDRLQADTAPILFSYAY